MILIPYRFEKVEKQKAKPRPPPRQSVELKIDFTSRGLLPTSTARESEDEKWKVKIQHMMDINKRKKNLEDATLDEQNPEFLKEKATQFFKSGNYEVSFSLLNIFSGCIECFYSCIESRFNQCILFIQSCIF